MGGAASVTINEEEVKRHLGVLFDDEAKLGFESCKCDETHASVNELLAWAKKEGKRYDERGFVFFYNLKELKTCRAAIQVMADEILSKGRVVAIPWVGKGVDLKQSVVALPEIYNLAAEAKKVYDATVLGALGRASVNTDAFVRVGLKSMLRAKEKAENEYGGEFSRLVDIVRGACNFKTEDALVDFYEALDADPVIDILRVKNRFNPPNFNGYRDLLTNIGVQVGEVSFICELQIHLTSIKESDILHKSHHAYEYFRTYFSGNMGAVKERLGALLTLPVEGIDSVDSLVERMMSAPEEHDLGAMLRLLEWMSEFAHAQRIRKYLLNRAESEGKETEEYALQLLEMGSLLDDQGKYDEAILLIKESLGIYKNVKGNEDKDYAAVVDNLASLYCKQSKHNEAELLYKESLAIRKKVLGEDHSDYAMSLNNLALLYYNLRKFDSAEPLYKNSLAIYKRLYGEDHLEVTAGLNNLAELYQKQLKYDAAEALLKESLAIRKRVLGEDHPEYATSLHNLGAFYLEVNKLEDAFANLQRAVEIRIKVLGEDHQDTKISQQWAWYVNTQLTKNVNRG